MLLLLKFDVIKQKVRVHRLVRWLVCWLLKMFFAILVCLDYVIPLLRFDIRKFC